MMSCAHGERNEDYGLGLLDEERAHEAAAHATECATCAEELLNLRAERGLLKRGQGRGDPTLDIDLVFAKAFPAPAPTPIRSARSLRPARAAVFASFALAACAAGALLLVRANTARTPSTIVADSDAGTLSRAAGNGTRPSPPDENPSMCTGIDNPGKGAPCGEDSEHEEDHECPDQARARAQQQQKCDPSVTSCVGRP